MEMTVKEKVDYLINLRNGAIALICWIQNENPLKKIREEFCFDIKD